MTAWIRFLRSGMSIHGAVRRTATVIAYSRMTHAGAPASPGNLADVRGRLLLGSDQGA